MLRTPSLRVPDSLTGQLEFIKSNWGGQYLSEFFLKLLGSLDMLSEEAKARAMFFQAAPDFQTRKLSSLNIDPVTMPGVNHWQKLKTSVRTAIGCPPCCHGGKKNAFVWLNQLSRKYQRPIETLDQIP